MTTNKKGVVRLQKIRRILKMKFKKVLATTMAVAMVMASSITAFAWEAPNYVLAKKNVLVAGDANQTQVAGDYSAECVRGVAVLTDYQDVMKGLGLVHGQVPTVVIYDAEKKSSPDAMATLAAAAENEGATTVASIYFQLGAKENHKWMSDSKIKESEVTVKVGLPENADRSKSYSVICVKNDGEATILADLDNSNKTVTFMASTGVATYGIITK